MLKQYSTLFSSAIPKIKMKRNICSMYVVKKFLNIKSAFKKVSVHKSSMARWQKSTVVD